ncbi:MAG: hypothetical protein ACFFD4_39740 [Candidatus Odinarchaeota archaeon]
MTVERKNLSPGKAGNDQNNLNDLAMTGNCRSGLDLVNDATGKHGSPVIIREDLGDGEFLDYVIIEFPLNRESYNWLVHYCDLTTAQVAVIFLTDEVNQYFGAFKDNRDWKLHRDLCVKHEVILMETRGNDKTTRKAVTTPLGEEPATVSVKAALFKNYYDWLVAFCKLARIDFLSFFTREINGYFDSFHGGEHVRSFRQAFVGLLEDTGRLE